jgi:hypothetical protein
MRLVHVDIFRVVPRRVFVCVCVFVFVCVCVCVCVCVRVYMDTPSHIGHTVVKLCHVDVSRVLPRCVFVHPRPVSVLPGRVFVDF